MVDTRQAAGGLHLLTVDALLEELVAGRSVAVSEGESLSLEGDADRSVLDWYAHNRDRWAGNLRAEDAEAIVDAVDLPPPASAAERAVGGNGARRILRLVRLRAHRFAGLQAYGAPGGGTEPFLFEPGRPATLVEGGNGSGKTSIANAVMWCLTGYLIRSQREPALGTGEFPCEVDRGGAATNHLMSSVTPMPRATDALPAAGVALPADTWVEVTLADEQGIELPPVRRTQSRGPRGKLVEEAPDLDGLGVDPVAWRIATVMPALLPYLAVGSTSQLGEAVARLTGLAELVDLSKHATKASDRIGKRMLKEFAAERKAAVERYAEIQRDLGAAAVTFAGMGAWEDLPGPAEADAEERLAACSSRLAGLKAAALEDARGILGVGFDPESEPDRNGLERDIAPAAEQVGRVADLPSVRRLSALSVDDAGREGAMLLLRDIEFQAATLEEMAASPDRARRIQLYARVSAWMREHEHVGDSCPVCSRPLDGAVDPISGTAVGSHLADVDRDRDFVARSAAEWSAHWRGHLATNLPDIVGVELRRDLPETPVALLRAGLVEELFGTSGFAGVLRDLRPDVEDLVDGRLRALPPYEEPPRRLLPEVLRDRTGPLQEIVDRTVRALAFADWRRDNAAAIRGAFVAVLKGTDGEPDADRAIGRRLSSLQSVVRGAAPLNTAMELTNRLERVRATHASLQMRMDACERACASLNALVPLGGLAQAQVDLLRGKLHRRADHWRRQIFMDPTTFSPFLADTRMDARGVLELHAGRLGVTAPAQHVSNASSLRAAILGFFLAFREHVLATRGGLSLLCLDDPQELLDNDNRERLARGLASLASGDAQLIVTTYDRKFARSFVAECRPADGVQHLSVHPVNAGRHTVVLSPAVEEVDRKRQAFESNSDSPGEARDYASHLRVFIEARLGDLFDSAAHPAHATASRAPTLNNLMDRLRGLVASGAGEPFTHPIVRRFAGDAALAEGTEARRILNQSHHDMASIGYADVLSVKEPFARLRNEIEKVHEQFRLHRWREPLVPADNAEAVVVPFPTMPKPTFSVPVCPDLAAFSAGSPGQGSQDGPTDTIDGEWFEGKSLFYIRTDTLGFAIPSGAVAIVEAEPYPGRDQHLVIAKHKSQLMARRVVKTVGIPGISLSSQMPDPRTNRSTVTYDESKVRLHRVVGALFTEMPPPDGARNEAAPVDNVPELGRIEAAYRVREESAVPLVLPGQLVLGGGELMASDLDRWEGRLVAVTLDDGASVFKRVGSRLPGSLAHLRQFETIGGLGGSLVVATEPHEYTRGIPTMVSVRRILGVLYDAG